MTESKSSIKGATTITDIAIDFPGQVEDDKYYRLQGRKLSSHLEKESGQ